MKSNGGNSADGAKAPGGGPGRRSAGRASIRARSGEGAPAADTGPYLVKPADLRWNCPPIKASGTPPTAAFLLGQERPMAALRTGLSIHAQGYNLFVSGLMGSGR